MSNTLLDALGLGGSYEPTVEEMEYRDALRYAVIEAGFSGDDDDARTVRAYVNMMKQVAADISDHKSRKVSRAIAEPIGEMVSAGGKLLDALQHLAVIRATALGIDIDKVRDSVPKPDSLRQTDPPPFPDVGFMGPMGSAG